jgi:dipeptidase D
MPLSNIEPQIIWKNFSALNAVPRPSKKEERVIKFIVDFAKSLQLDYIIDEVGNVIVKKPATFGMENRKNVVLQSHLDMVHQKNNDTVFDFDKQGIDMYIDGDFVKAKGTTLGADNGLGVATIMAILESTDIPHPAIEALFTIDEETGMTGAMGLKAGILTGEILLNLDTEEDDELDIGCAGGIDVTAIANYDEEDIKPDDFIALEITVKGLRGGHSGMDIHKGFGNANKIMNRLLFHAHEDFGLQIVKLNGGSLRNAIPRESVAHVLVPKIYEDVFLFESNEIIKDIKNELKTTEPNLQISISNSDKIHNKVMPSLAQFYFLRAIYAAHNGVYRMSADFDNLVETSNNIAKIKVEAGEVIIENLTRSSVESSKYDLAHALKSVYELMGCEVTFSGAYPGWTPNPNSAILKVMSENYERLFDHKPRVVACHAGLECGILGQNYPQMDMISFGPNIYGAHSPDECASISSVEKYWQLVKETLNNIPIK